MKSGNCLPLNVTRLKNTCQILRCAGKAALRGTMHPAASSVVRISSPMNPFRPCGPHPGMPPASRASRPPVRGATTLVRTCCRGDCSSPSVHGPLPSLRGTFPVRGDGWGLVQMASPWGKLSAKLTEGVPARSNLPFCCKPKYAQNLAHGPLHRLRGPPSPGKGGRRTTKMTRQA